MFTFNILTLAIVGLGMTSGRNLQGSMKCYEVSCTAETKDESCVRRGAESLPESAGVISVTGKSIKFISIGMPFQTYLHNCPTDPNSKFTCVRPDHTVPCKNPSTSDIQPPPNNGSPLVGSP